MADGTGALGEGRGRQQAASAGLLGFILSRWKIHLSWENGMGVSRDNPRVQVNAG